MKYPLDYDFAQTETGKQRRERWATDLIWFLAWVGCAAPFLALFFREATR